MEYTMPAYVLRYRGTNTLAGLYAADNPTLLGDLIDQETDPGDYEYAIVPEGFGIEFRTRKGWTVDFTIGGTGEQLGAALAKVKHIYMTDELLSALVGYGKLRWRRIF
jgi:hypothetical protein